TIQDHAGIVAHGDFPDDRAVSGSEGHRFSFDDDLPDRNAAGETDENPGKEATHSRKKEHPRGKTAHATPCGEGRSLLTYPVPRNLQTVTDELQMRRMIQGCGFV